MSRILKRELCWGQERLPQTEEDMEVLSEEDPQDWYQMARRHHRHVCGSRMTCRPSEKLMPMKPMKMSHRAARV